ncbi:MAG TPA: TA system VapC family ribonuclease toxin [Steroidobacteraceae bacterium]|nr:TA system VapC family ribonuclease toxin [Steroidobacteraceae bacterium]
MIPDVNIVVAAYRADHVHHQAARGWLMQARKECAAGIEPLVLLPIVISGFLRLVTNRRVFPQPDSIEDAIAFVDAILESPGAELRTPEDDWPLLRDKLLTLRLAGNAVTDAAIASMVQALSEHLVSFDRDFTRLLPTRDLTLLKPKV